MVKKFSINCDFGGAKAPFDFYVGLPKDGNHPIANQAKWLGDNKGGNPPSDIMESFSKILKLSIEHNVDFEELCVHAFKEAYRMQSSSSETQKEPEQEPEFQPEPVKPRAPEPVKQVSPPPPPPKAAAPVIAPKAVVEKSVQQTPTAPVKKEVLQPQTQTQTTANLEIRNEPKFETGQSAEVKTEPLQKTLSQPLEIQKNPEPSPQSVIQAAPIASKQVEPVKQVITPKPVLNNKKEEDEGNILDW